MLRFNQTSTPTFVGRIIFFMIVAMIITHLVVFVIYSHIDKEESMKVNRDLMVQQILHVIQVVLNTPDETQKSVISAVDIPNISISLSKEPLEKIVLTDFTFWDILEKVNKQHDVIKLSLYLSSDQWLNISALIVARAWTMQLFLLSLEVILAGAVLFYYWSINRFTEPVKNFAVAAERLGRDLHSSPLVEAGPPVVRDAVRAMNQMQNRIREMVRERTLMLAAISHDLRTPITRLKLRAQLLHDKEIQRKNMQDLDEMEDMISEILILAKEEDQSLAKTKIDFASLLSSLCDDLYDTYEKVYYEGPQARVYMLGKSLALKRAFTNLIVNAMKYGHVAHVKLFEPQNNVIKVIIEDEGPGIPVDEIDKVFSPFYRGEKSRSRKTGGTGLGLAVAKEIIQVHQGKVILVNREEGGLKVIIELPV